ncbi:uncharacterized protein LOC124362341 isoform X2 [Homalodisca vitripennis]|uniref:uncharacterized protein LOC124362341 isoform X2 n=1 Tax=Homalodisca vitripennis TaxID=197043 RepID=UPI001EEC1FF0|nr:uncharacterized protein LOC124362341 isoform X2 [Homalodisca vitripennis]
MFTVETQIVPVAVLILCIGTLASVEPSSDRPLNSTVPKFNVTTLPARLTEDDIKNISLIRRKEGCDEGQEKAYLLRRLSKGGRVTSKCRGGRACVI